MCFSTDFIITINLVYTEADLCFLQVGGRRSIELLIIYSLYFSSGKSSPTELYSLIIFFGPHDILGIDGVGLNLRLLGDSVTCVCV